jgi:hypothetical protein
MRPDVAFVLGSHDTGAARKSAELREALRLRMSRIVTSSRVSATLVYVNVDAGLPSSPSDKIYYNKVTSIANVTLQEMTCTALSHKRLSAYVSNGSR